MQALHAMQQARIIHTDIKPDNCILAWPPQLHAGVAAAAPCWTAAAADRDGSEWAGGCLQVIDFGRAIDLELLPVGTQFIGSSTTEGMQCPEMLEGKPWHFCVRPDPTPVCEESGLVDGCRPGAPWICPPSRWLFLVQCLCD